MANLSNINGKFVVEQTTGFVGIGVTDPSQLLHLQSTADTILKIDNTTSGTGKSYLIRSTTAGSFIVRDEDASSNRLLIDTSGNTTFAGDVAVTGGDLTLGTDSIASNINGVGDVLNINVDSNTGGGAGANIQLKIAGTTQLTINSSSSTFGGDLYIPNKIIHVGDENTWMQFETDVISLRTGGTDRLTLTNTTATFAEAVTAPTFSGDLNGTINTVTTATTKGNATNDTTVATTAFVQNVVGTIPAGLVFQGTWNASTNTPTLTSGSGTTGHFYIVSVAGSTNLDGITDWQVGDWAVFIEQGASDQWEKIDNSSVLSGSGTGGSFAGWSGSGTSVTLGNAPVTFSGNNSTFAGDVTVTSTSVAQVFLDSAANNDAVLNFHEGGGQKGKIGYDTSISGIGLVAGSGSFATADMVVLDSGNVGILNTSPSSQLSIGGNAITTLKPTVVISDLTNGASLTLRGQSPILFFDGTAAGVPKILMDNQGIEFKTGTLDSQGDVHFKLDSSGNVGIGVTDPEKKLEVKSDTTYDGILIDTLSAPEINFRDRGNSDTLVGTGRHALDGFHIDTYSGNAFFIKGSNRYVGIGTTSPSQKLDVVGRTKITQSGDALRINSSDANGAYATWQNNGSAIGYVGTGYHLWSSPNNIAANLGIRAQARLDLGIQASVHMTIISSGNVGIGTTSPSNKLSLKGSGQNWSTSPAIKMWDSHNSKGWYVGSANNQSIGDFYIRSVTAEGAYPVAANQEFCINQAGNVGIGTINPAGDLHVVGKAGTAGRLYISDVDEGISGTDSILAMKLDTHAYYYNRDSGDLYLGTNNSAGQLTIKPSGNVGIGTTAPSQRLNVREDGGSDVFRGIEVHNNSTSQARAGIAFKCYDWVQSAIWHGRSTTGAYAGALVLGTNPNTNDLSVSGVTGRMWILNNGNVGIGTPSPGYPLQVNSVDIAAKFVGSQSGYTQGAIVLSSGTDSVPQARGQGVFRFNEGNDETWYTGTAYANTNRYIWARKSSTTSLDTSAAQLTHAMMSLTNDGKLGIGTTSPSSEISSSVTMLEINDTTNNNLASLALKAGTASSKWEMAALSSNALGFIGAGTERMRIDSSGRVGIGTVTNTAKLNVGGKVKITDDLIMAQTNGRIDYDNGVSSGALRFFSTSGNTERMRITSAGKVGIGNTTPLANLDIGNDYGSTYQRWSYDNPGANNYFLSLSETVTSGNVRFCFNQRNLGTNYNNVLVFNQGNVGIGTDSPSQKLHVNGSQLLSGSLYLVNTNTRISSDANGEVGINYGAGNTSTYSLSIYNSSSRVVGLGRTGNGYFAGSVGIGTTSPGAKLQVNVGSAIALYAGNACGHVGIGVTSTDISGNGLQPQLTVKGNISYGYNNYSSVANTWSNALNFSGYPAGLYQVNICKQSNASAYIIAQVKWSGTAGTVINTVTSFQYGITFSGTQLQSIINTTTATSISVQCLVTFESCLP